MAAGCGWLFAALVLIKAAHWCCGRSLEPSPGCSMQRRGGHARGRVLVPGGSPRRQGWWGQLVRVVLRVLCRPLSPSEWVWVLSSVWLGWEEQSWGLSGQSQEEKLCRLPGCS